VADVPEFSSVRLHKPGLVVEFATKHETHPFKGTVRPATVAELREQVSKESAAPSPTERSKVESAFYATHIKSWSLRDADTSEAIPPTADNIALLPPEYFHQLFGVVSGACGESLVGK
jgi:hypothetical protein